jgi:hypothetical protein
MADEASNRSSAAPHTMMPWCTEQSTNIVRELAALVDYLVACDDISEDVRTRLFDYLSPLTWDATKLLAFMAGASWSPDDRQALLEGGYDGYLAVADKYGLLKRKA